MKKFMLLGILAMTLISQSFAVTNLRIVNSDDKVRLLREEDLKMFVDQHVNIYGMEEEQARILGILTEVYKDENIALVLNENAETILDNLRFTGIEYELDEVMDYFMDLDIDFEPTSIAGEIFKYTIDADSITMGIISKFINKVLNPMMNQYYIDNNIDLW